MTLDAATAHAIVEAAHAAWRNGDIEAVLDQYVDDLVAITNAGPDWQPMIIEGKAAMRARYAPIMDIIDSRTTILSFDFDGSSARIRFGAFLRHRATGLEMKGTYREMCTFRGDKIARIEDFHDVAKIAAFWRLIEFETLQHMGDAVGL
ncbi:MAG: nuclear transport factor 2 family protein [Hyphomicrobium sp.]|uniref:nuclear transport factor 2 family protein n=1 Tax=Hyphomicrobium sp. TaxID=82 RepID=UPI0039E2C0A3